MMRLLTRLKRDERGVSAVEFALIAPLLIVFYFGMAEITQALMADRRAGHAASAIGDLVAQTDKVSNAEIDDIFLIAEKIMKPFSADTLKVRVSSISQNTSGVRSVDWSRPKGMSQLSSVPSLPNGLIANGQSIIVAEVSYTYESPVEYVIQEGITLNKTYYLRPRKSDKVSKTS